jgi:hypothetical protein
MIPDVKMSAASPDARSTSAGSQSRLNNMLTLDASNVGPINPAIVFDVVIRRSLSSEVGSDAAILALRPAESLVSPSVADAKQADSLFIVLPPLSGMIARSL